MKTTHFIASTITIATLASHASAMTLHNLSSPDLSAFSVAGAGSQANPLVITETINSVPAQGIKVGFRDVTGSSNPLWIRKIVTNNTGATWESFEQELGHQSLGGHIYGINSGTFLGSDDNDGLSFDQGASGRVTSQTNFMSGFYGPEGTFNSDQWSHVFIDETTQNRDFIQYFSFNPNDTVEHGETVEMVFRISWSTSSYGTNKDFILRQDVNVASVPEPATMGILGLGLAGAIARRRRRA